MERDQVPRQPTKPEVSQKRIQIPRGAEFHEYLERESAGEESGIESVKNTFTVFVPCCTGLGRSEKIGLGRKETAQ